MIPTYEIEWIGPYNNVDECDECNLLYILTGSKQGTAQRKIRSIGKTCNTASQRYRDPEHYFNKITESSRQVWIGKIKYSGSAKKDNSPISRAEKILIYYLFHYGEKRVKLLNDRLTKYPPKYTVGLINRWINKDSHREYTKQNFPMNFIPDLLFWDRSKFLFYSAFKAEIWNE